MEPRFLIIPGLGMYLFYKGFRWWEEKKLIENTPTSKVRSLAMGFVEVYGKVAPFRGKLLSAPFSKKPCVWCRWTVEEYKSRGKSSHWDVIQKGTLGDYFLLNDGTGTVLVDSRGATIDIPLDFEAENGMFGKRLPPAALSFLETNNIQLKSMFGLSKKIRVRESFLAPQDLVYIMGSAGDNPLVKEGTSTKNEADITIQKGKGFYYISDKQEKDVLKSHRLKVFGGLFGGAALIIFGLFIVFLDFGIL